MDPQEISRVYSKISKTDTCWEWTGAIGSSGYGNAWTNIRGKYECINAHRLMWLITFGEIPDGMYVCHSCDNRKCVRPEHLFLGSAQDNIRDALVKGRLKHPCNKGERNGRAVLCENQLKELQELHAKGIPSRKLSSMFGVCKSTINNYLSGKSWQDCA